jgi:hypothetical protein
LPGRKALLKSDMEYEVVLIDVTETPIERPKKKHFYSGKKKKHTLKTQIIVDKKKKLVICTNFTMLSGMILDCLRNQVFYSPRDKKPY